MVLSLLIIPILLTERIYAMSNEEIRQLLKKEKIYMWQLAKVLEIHETTFGKWFREPLSENRKKAILSAIETIKQTKTQEENN